MHPPASSRRSDPRAPSIYLLTNSRRVSTPRSSSSRIHRSARQPVREGREGGVRARVLFVFIYLYLVFSPQGLRAWVSISKLTFILLDVFRHNVFLPLSPEIPVTRTTDVATAPSTCTVATYLIIASVATWPRPPAPVLHPRSRFFVASHSLDVSSSLDCPFRPSGPWSPVRCCTLIPLD